MISDVAQGVFSERVLKQDSQKHLKHENNLIEHGMIVYPRANEESLLSRTPKPHMYICVNSITDVNIVVVSL